MLTTLPPHLPLHTSPPSPPSRWYSDRAEVRRWQADTKSNAVKDARAYRVPFVTTLLGRNRPLPDLMSSDRRRPVQGAGKGRGFKSLCDHPVRMSAQGSGALNLAMVLNPALQRPLKPRSRLIIPPSPRRRHHAERAAINSPIQGSAADVANSAMVAIAHCPDLKRMGWKLLMQVCLGGAVRVVKRWRTAVTVWGWKLLMQVCGGGSADSLGADVPVLSSLPQFHTL